MLERLSLKNQFWYLATPYSKYPGGIEMAFQHACEAAGELLKSGVHCFCPIAHSHPVAVRGGLDPLSHKIFIPLDAQFMTHAYGLLIVKMPGWDESKGIAIERRFFEARMRPILELEWPKLAITPPPKS